MTNNVLTQDEAIALLDLLITDPAYRDEFQNDPGAALARVSVAASAAAKECCVLGKLASAAELSAAREQLVQQLTKSSAFSLPFAFVEGTQRTDR